VALELMIAAKYLDCWEREKDGNPWRGAEMHIT
jgi:hypothetical protein